MPESTVKVAPVCSSSVKSVAAATLETSASTTAALQQFKYWRLNVKRLDDKIGSNGSDGAVAMLKQ